jgi:NADPH:quinone reductase-like Zn-dependent oxidoreductase
MATMKAVRISEYGAGQVMGYGDAPRPEPGADELLVRVRAASVNPVDWKMREGYLRAWVDPPRPLTLGRDMAGDVVEVGSEVTGYQVGEAVFGTVPLDKGTHAEYVVVRPAQVARKPVSLDYQAAAAIPLAALAAWQGLMDAGGLQAGQTVLIHGAAGGVGSFAVQFAHLQGARVVATAAQENTAFVRSLGADEVIDYEQTSFEAVAHDIDIVLDTLGAETQDRSWQVLKAGGVLVTLIYLSPEALERAATLGVRGVMTGAQPNGAQLQQIAELIDGGKVRLVVSEVLPLAEARRAYDRVQAGHTHGKVVLQMAGAGS